MNSSPNFADGSIVVVGVKVIGSVGGIYGIMRQDGRNLIGDGKESWSWDLSCLPNSKSCVDGIAYHYYRMPPGEYAIGWVMDDKWAYFLIDAKSVKEERTVSYQMKANWHNKFNIEQALMNAGTPRFTVGRNEVLYIGDIIFDLTHENKPFSSFSKSEEAARSVLASSGETRPMLYRPWTRPNGNGPQPILRRIGAVTLQQNGTNVR